MAVNNKTIIRFPRCSNVLDSRELALLHLTEEVTYVVGQPVITSYYTDQSRTSVDTIIAMGVKNGKGKDCFSIVHTGQFVVVNNVVKRKPDITVLVHGEIYLFNDVEDPDKPWYLVYSRDGIHRDREPLDERPRFYINLQDNSLWASGTDRIARPLYNTYTRDEVDDIIEQLKIETDFEKIEEKLDEAVEKSNAAYDKTLELEEEIKHIEIGTESIDTIARIHSTLEVHLVSILDQVTGEWVPVESTWFDTMKDSVSFVGESMKFSLVYHNYDGTDLDYTKFNNVTVQLEGEEFVTSLEPAEDGYFLNPDSIVLRKGEDMYYKFIFSAENPDNEIAISNSVSIYGIRGSKYFGRVEGVDDLDLSTLTKVSSDYNWDNLKTINLNILGGDLNKFIYLYPSAWGELSEIYSGGLSYYRVGNSRATFMKTTLTIDETEFNAYIYRNINGDEADNVTFE